MENEVTKIDDNTIGITQSPIMYTMLELDNRVRAAQQRVVSMQSQLDIAQNELTKWTDLQAKGVELGLQSIQ